MVPMLGSVVNLLTPFVLAWIVMFVHMPVSAHRILVLDSRVTMCVRVVLISVTVVWAVC